MDGIRQYIRENIAALDPYSTARDEYKGELGILLDANESPYGSGVNRYPGSALKEKLRGEVARIRNVAPERLFLGNGSDEAIDLLYRIFCEPHRHNAIIIAPSYGMYSVCADINAVERRMVSLRAESFALDADALLAASDGNSRLMFVCSPNNPTGNSFALSDIERLAREFRGIVAVDEAYIDFSASESAVPLTEKYPNLIVLQTLSKAWGMAGLRIGLAIGNPEIIGVMRQVKYPYNIGTDTLSLALEMLAHNDVAAQVAEIASERARVAAALEEAGCVQRVFPSDANFLLVRCSDPRGLYGRLLRAGVIVRDRSGVPLCGGCLRITIGTPAENDKLIETVRNYE